MAGERAERRLAAIFAGDIAGYSRLMGADEEGTLARINSLRREFLDPKIWPDFKEIQKYFSPSGGYGVASDEGFMVTSFTIKHAK